MSSHHHSHHTASLTFEDLKTGFKGLHGAGDALRGNINGFIDHAFHDTKGEATDKEISQKGVEDFKAAARRLAGGSQP